LERLKWNTLATIKVKASKNIYDVFLYYKQMQTRTGNVARHEAPGNRGIRGTTNHDHLKLV
jgi:hypothetical protein